MHAEHDELDGLLGELAAAGPPPLTMTFNHAVQREIRRQREDADGAALFHGILDWLTGGALRPRPVAAALALALTVGVLIGAGLFNPTPRAVRLDAFFVRAPGLLSTSIK
ncbi:MAG: hypothetical protein LBK60_03515 [Verrucomicrobiales bacterium]|jgi:hypothetical protein|nr:hypothetical protein [Verrucomicrobiales bacterium]